MRRYKVKGHRPKFKPNMDADEIDALHAKNLEKHRENVEDIKEHKMFFPRSHGKRGRK